MPDVLGDASVVKRIKAKLTGVNVIGYTGMGVSRPDWLLGKFPFLRPEFGSGYGAGAE